MSRKTFCDMRGAEIKGSSSKVAAVSAEHEGLVRMHLKRRCYGRLR